MTTNSEENAFGFGIMACLLFLVVCVIIFAIGFAFGADSKADRINKTLESKGLGHYVVKDGITNFVLHVDEKSLTTENQIVK